MATLVHTSRDGNQLGTLIAAYLTAVETGRTLDRTGERYSPAAVRSLRRALTQVEAAAEDVSPAALAVMDSAALERLGRKVIDDAGLPPNRLGSIVEALRGLAAYAGARRVPTAAPEPEPEPEPAAAPEARTPTFAMLALGAQVSVWMERIVVIAFILTAIGLAIELV